MKIFNHDITLSTHDQSAGISLFSGRALGLTHPEDTIQIHPELTSEWDDIVDHYAQVGLSHSQQVIWTVDLAEIDRHPEYDACFYFFGDAVNLQSPQRQFFQQRDPHWCQVVEFINSKNNFVHLAEELGIAVPQTLRFDTLAAAQAFEAIPFPVYVKPAVSDHGVGIMRCPDEASLAAAFARLNPDESLQIQAEVQASSFLNLQYQVTPDGVEPLLVSEQILDGCVHGGNRYPSAHEPWEKIAPFAEWMGDRGMKGIFAVDVAVVPEAGGTRYLAIECNPRYNGSSYPTLVAQKLGISQWSSATCHTSKRSLKDLDLGDLTFDAETGTGVILINWGTIKAGKISVLLAGTESAQATLSTELETRLNA